MKKRVSIDLDDEIYNKFRHFCQRRAYKISAKLQLMIEEEMKSSNKDDGTLLGFFKKIIGQKKTEPKKVAPAGSRIIKRDVKPIAREETPKPAARNVPTLDQLRYRMRR